MPNLARRNMYHAEFCAMNPLGTYDNYEYMYEGLESLVDAFIFVPCRKCPACLRNRSFEWKSRLVREYNYWHVQQKRTLFVTLTYDEKYIKCVDFNKDLALLFDRLRSKFRRNIRHFCISELGEKKGRFHIHALFFDPPPELAPDSHFHLSKNGALMGSNSILRERWQKGIVDVGFVKDVRAISYVADYLSKAQPSKHNEEFISPINSSNGLGFLDVDSFEIDRIRESVCNFKLPTFRLFGRDYTYPSCVLRKYLDFFERYALSVASRLKQVARGGAFKIGDFVTDSYFAFRRRVSYAVGLLPMFSKYSFGYEWSLAKNIKPQFFPELIPEDPNFVPF